MENFSKPVFCLPHSEPSSSQSPGQKHTPLPPTPPFRRRIPSAGPPPALMTPTPPPPHTRPRPGLPRAGLTVRSAPGGGTPQTLPPCRASRRGRPDPLPSPQPRLPGTLQPHRPLPPRTGCPLRSSLTGPRSGLSGPSGRSRLSVRGRIGACGPGRGIGPGVSSSASRTASSHSCHLCAPPRPTEPKPRPGPGGSDVTTGQPTPLGLRSSAHGRAWGARARGWLPGRGAGSRGVFRDQGREASLVTWIWVLWTGGGSL